jgi:shikimate 5-dehydrogenase
MNTINKDTKVYGSFSSKPGNNGCIFFNKKFQENGINAIYKSFKTDNILSSIVAAKVLDFGGFAVSMPFKVEVLKHVNEVDFAAKVIGAANTIVNNNGFLKAYNTDWIGVYNYLSLLTKPEQLYILGNGGFGKAVEYACIQLNIPCRFILRAEWDKVPNLEGMVFNATPIDVEVKGTLIDGRPFVEGQGRVIADLQAEEQYKIYTKWMM